MKQIINILLSATIVLGILSSCTDFLDPEMRNNAAQSQLDKVAETDPNLIATGFIQGIYGYMGDGMTEHDDAGIMAFNLAGDLLTPDMIQTLNHWFFYDYQIDNRGATYRRTIKTWEWCNTVVAKANEIIDFVYWIQPNIESADANKPALRAIIGQAFAVRAMGLHYAIQRYQQTYIGNEDKPGIPIHLTPYDDDETDMSRGTVRKVYERIIKDYTKAYELLAGFERTAKGMIDQNVAAGLMARAYMVTNDWGNAQKYAKLARTGYSLMTHTEAGTKGYNDISNKEWMWGEAKNSETTNIFASFQSHICTEADGYAGVVGAYKCMDTLLYSSIGENDARRNLYEYNADYGQIFNYKFFPTPAWTSHNPYMRVSEMYLIEAEAMVQAGNTGRAATVMNEFMAERDPDWNNPSPTVEDIFLQKRIELWGEGIIFYDYIRHKKDLIRDYPTSTHLVKDDIKAGSWRLIYAIPQGELDNNSEINEADQNPVPTDY